MSQKTIEVQDIEVEHAEDESRNRSRTRNSWAEPSERGSEQGRRKSVKLMGQENIMDKLLEWRVKWGQHGIRFFGFIALICYIVAGGRHAGLLIAAIVFGAITLIFFGILYYKNISLVVMKRLLREMNVVVIVILSLCNMIIDIGRPMNSFDPIMGSIYMLVVNGFVFMDALKLKSRIFIIAFGSLFTLLNLYCIYGNTFGDWSNGIVLLNYTILGEEYTIMKRSTKRSIFIQILLFSMTGIYTLFKDKKMELMIFATGNIYRETGTASKDLGDEVSELGGRKSEKLLGQKNVMDKSLEWRVKWAQRGMSLFALIALMSYVVAGGRQVGGLVSAIVSSVITFVFIGILYYKNISLVVMKRLLREMNVAVIVILSLCNMIIDIRQSIDNPIFGPIMGIIYVLVVSGFVFMDAIKLKSRIFIIVYGSLFTLLNLYCIYGNTFGVWGNGEILFNYKIQGEEYTIMKRSTKRSVFIQILLFGMTGIYTLFKDKKTELMIFATGNIYRETGTASKDVEDETFSTKIKQEKQRSSSIEQI